jgi:hypothetical protein
MRCVVVAGTMGHPRAGVLFEKGSVVNSLHVGESGVGAFSALPVFKTNGTCCVPDTGAQVKLCAWAMLPNVAEMTAASVSSADRRRLGCSPRLLASVARLGCSPRLLASVARLGCSPRLLASVARLGC